MDTVSSWKMQAIKFLAHCAMYNCIQLETHRIIVSFEQHLMLIKPRLAHFRLLNTPINANPHPLLHITSYNNYIRFQKKFA